MSTDASAGWQEEYRHQGIRIPLDSNIDICPAERPATEVESAEVGQ